MEATFTPEPVFHCKGCGTILVGNCPLGKRCPCCHTVLNRGKGPTSYYSGSTLKLGSDLGTSFEGPKPQQPRPEDVQPENTESRPEPKVLLPPVSEHGRGVDPKVESPAISATEAPAPVSTQAVHVTESDKVPENNANQHEKQDEQTGVKHHPGEEDQKETHPPRRTKNKRLRKMMNTKEELELLKQAEPQPPLQPPKKKQKKKQINQSAAHATESGQASSASSAKGIPVPEGWDAMPIVSMEAQKVADGRAPKKRGRKPKVPDSNEGKGDNQVAGKASKKTTKSQKAAAPKSSASKPAPKSSPKAAACKPRAKAASSHKRKIAHEAAAAPKAKARRTRKRNTTGSSEVAAGAETQALEANVAVEAVVAEPSAEPPADRRRRTSAARQPRAPASNPKASRKSAAYHRARLAAKKEGKSDEEAKVIAKQETKLNSIIFLIVCKFLG